MTESLHAARRRGLFALFFAAMMLIAAVAAPAAFAQDESETPAAAPEFLMIDATEDPYVIIRTSEQPSRVDVSVAGFAIDSEEPVAMASSDIPVQTIIVIDNSSESSEFLDSFLTAADDYVRRAPNTEQIEVWTTGGVARLRAGFNNGHERTREIIANILSGSGGNKLWDGVRGAVLNLEDPIPGATNVVVLTANIDNESTSSAGEARGAVLNAGASVFMLHGSETTSAEEPRLVEVSAGGAYAAIESPTELAVHGSSISQVIGSTWKVGFAAEAAGYGRTLDVTVDGVTTSGTFSDNARTSGRALAPITAPDPTTLPGLGFLEGETGRTVGLALGAVAAALCAYSIAMLFQKDTSGLDAVLGVYTDPYAQSADEEGGTGFAKNLFLKRAVEITEGIAERRGTLERAEALLERADMPLRAGEAMTAYVGIVLAALAFGLVLVGGLPGLVIMGALGVLLPPFILRFLAARRSKKFMSQLPDTLNLLSSTLKAGYSFMQGVEAVSHEIEDPMGGELRRIVTEAQLGRPLEDAMDASAERMDSDDFAWAVMAVKIQREVGGNLSELLLTVAETMTERERLRRDVATLTAEGKMSAIVLGVLPILLGMAMWAMNPEYINTLFTDSLGKILLGASIVAALVGFAWMKKIISIEI